MPFGIGKSKQRRQLPEMTDEYVAWLDAGVEVEGKVKFASGIIKLNTHFKGEITCEGMILVDDQGEIEGEMHTKLISVSGKVKGNVHASERLEIKEHGIVLGTLYTPCLVIEPGGYFDGQCHMPTPEPEKHATKNQDFQDHPR